MDGLYNISCIYLQYLLINRGETKENQIDYYIEFSHDVGDDALTKK